MAVNEDDLNKVTGGRCLGMYLDLTNDNNSYYKLKCDKCGEIQKIHFDVSVAADIDERRNNTFCESCGTKISFSTDLE